MGDSYEADAFIHYMNLTIKAFLAVRRYEDHLYNTIKMMANSGLKCFKP